MNISFTYSPLFLLLIVPLAALAAWWMYRGTRDLLPRGVQMFLTGLRFLALCLIGLILLQPVITTLTRLTYPPIVAVLQDQTESLAVQRDSQFVRQQYPEQLKAFLSAFPTEDYQVDLYGFSTGLEGVVSPDSLRFDQVGTNLSDVLSDVEDLYQNQNLGAIVLVSDGISTAGVNPVYTVDGIREPVFTVLLGDTTTQQDLKIKEVLFNEIAYLETETPIRANIQSSGYKNAQVKVSLKSAGKVLDSETIKIGENDPEVSVDFLIKPKEVGIRQYVVEVSRLDQEITYRNNVQQIFINVLETRVKIGLFAGGPHPDLGALRMAFDRDERYELVEFIHKSPSTFYNDPGNANLEEFDLFILHNFPVNSQDRPWVTKLSELVKEQKKPVMYWVGQRNDLRIMGPLFEDMALAPSGFTPKSEEVIADFSREYRDHSTFTFEDSWLRWINSAPPIFRNQSTWQPKTTAEVFATAKIKNIALDYPVFALQNHLGRKNMVFVGENFWRYRQHSFVETDDFEMFDEWLFSVIKWLIVSDDKRKFKVAPTKKMFTGSEPVFFKGQAYDDSYNPISGVEIKMKLTAPDGKVTDYYLNEASQGQYFLELANLEQGTYRYAAEGFRNNVSIGKDRGQFSIGRSNVEHYQLQANRDLMEQLALRTGGEFALAQDFPALAADIQALPGLKPVIDYKKARKPLLDFWWLMVILLSMLSIEWVVRKLHSML
ncbi:VWA domain-containing protein [Pontibacter sp. G13]|uniref:vWA domain-containing protein n=1 Tax=Pontibacter sp. G13 TaxID=3074898 RepID=UPI00288B39B6|nr:VWA domain-containing protein [Pontibacter sp. G13]WNJ16629.1 VWA domain-containing protein [Pontibacter sp. G13]